MWHRIFTCISIWCFLPSWLGAHAEIYGSTLKMEFPHLRFSTINTACCMCHVTWWEIHRQGSGLICFTVLTCIASVPTVLHSRLIVIADTDRESRFYEFKKNSNFVCVCVCVCVDFKNVHKFWLKNNRSSSQSQKHSTVTSRTQISVIQSQNQQQPIVPIQQLFQHSSQPECSPVYQ